MCILPPRRLYRRDLGRDAESHWRVHRPCGTQRTPPVLADDETVNLRAKAALAAGMRVMICLGEVKEQRLAGITNEIISMQTKLDLAGISEEQLQNIIIAYEPVWAIGTGLTATPEQAEEACAVIRRVVAGIYSQEAAEKLRILYGGSMNEKNAAELLSKPNVDGGLVGGASLVPEKFAVIANSAE